MELVRRQFLEALAKFGLTASFGGLSLGLVFSPGIDPEDYLDLCSASMGTWWGWLNQGRYHELERVLLKHVPILKRLATIISPFQGIAASLAIQAKIMQITLACRNLDFVESEILVVKLSRWGHCRGTEILASALCWQGIPLLLLSSTASSYSPSA